MGLRWKLGFGLNCNGGMQMGGNWERLKAGFGFVMFVIGFWVYE